MTIQAKSDDLHRFDYLLIINIAALLIIGLMMIYSATFALGYQLHEQPTYYFIRQLLWVALGTLALIVFAHIEYHTWRRYSILLMAVTLLLLVLVLAVERPAPLDGREPTTDVHNRQVLQTMREFLVWFLKVFLGSDQRPPHSGRRPHQGYHVASVIRLGA